MSQRHAEVVRVGARCSGRLHLHSSTGVRGKCLSGCSAWTPAEPLTLQLELPAHWPDPPPVPACGAPAQHLWLLCAPSAT